MEERHAYPLDGASEGMRLESQGRMLQYSVDAELSNIDLRNCSQILDAGCGSGIASRYFCRKFPRVNIEGWDSSPERIAYARSLCSKEELERIQFRVRKLPNYASTSRSFDFILCRYVLEHQRDPRKLLDHFYDLLPVGGRLVIVDLESAVYDLVTENPELQLYLSQVKSYIAKTLTIPRFYPRLLLNAGFKLEDWDVSTMTFKGHDLFAERELNRWRFSLLVPVLAEILGGQSKVERFSELYLKEMLVPGNILFYQKFIIKSRKC